MKVNLLKKRSQAYSINWMKIGIVITVVLFILGIGLYHYLLSTESIVLKTENINLDKHLKNLRIRVAEYNKLKNKVEELENIKEKMISYNYFWDKVILELGYVIPTETMLNNFEIENSSLSLYGIAENNQKVLDMIDNMNLSPIYDDVKLIEIIQDNDVIFKIEAKIIDEVADRDV